MTDRAKVWGIFLIFLVIVSMSHLFVHLAFYGSGISGFAEKGISGFAIENDEGGLNKLPISEIILFMEWGMIFLGVLFVYAKHRIDLRREFGDLKLLKEKAHFSNGTELDNFYELLQQVKHFRLSTAAKVFNVEQDVIEDWAKSLESSKVAELTYPRIGGPEVRLKILQKTVDEDEDGSGAAGANAKLQIEKGKAEISRQEAKSKEESMKNISTEKNKTVKG